MKKEDDTNTSKTGKKIDRLQNQYKNILIDLFKDHAGCCIEEALENSSGPIGGDIEDIVSGALEGLRGKVMNDLGIAGPAELDVGDGLSLGGVIEIGPESDTDDSSDSDDSFPFDNSDDSDTDEADTDDDKTDDDD